MAAILASHPPDVAVRHLVDTANEAGGPDNVTALVVHSLSPAASRPFHGLESPGCGSSRARAVSATTAGPARSTRRTFRRTSGSPSTRRSSRPSRSTTPSTGCRSPSCSRAGPRQVPKTFRFALKAPQRITHIKRLKETAEEVRFLTGSARQLGENRGPILFGLPPNLKKDVPRLDAFLALLPPDFEAAFEFRNATWLDDEVYALLRKAGAALCVAEDEKGATPLVATATWGYLRLRREDYGEADLDAWAARVAAQAWESVYVFFKHEDEARAPELARRFAERLEK